LSNLNIPHIRIGVHRGNVVAVKAIHRKSIDLNRTILKELNSVKEIQSNNLKRAIKFPMIPDA